MKLLKITLSDGSTFEKDFPSRDLMESFLAKLELFEGLFLDVGEGESFLRINPKFIVKVEEAL